MIVQNPLRVVKVGCTLNIPDGLFSLLCIIFWLKLFPFGSNILATQLPTGYWQLNSWSKKLTNQEQEL